MQGALKRDRGRGLLVSAPRKAVKAIFALTLASALVPAVAVQEAFAAEVQFVGTIITQPLFDEDGYPIFNEDGTIARGKPQITLSEVRNAPETLVVPDTMDVIEENGAQTIVHQDVPVTVLDFLSWGRASGFPGIKSIDASQVASLVSLGCTGMASLEAITCEGSSVRSVHFQDNSLLSSVNLENCPDLVSFALSGNPGLSLDCMDPIAQNLENIDIYNRDDIVDFDASGIPGLTTLNIGHSSLASIDVSQNEKLEMLQLMGNQLTSLESDAIPSGVKIFNCTQNHIQDTDALVARFGRNSVLPQSDAPLCGLSIVNKYEASGRLAAGESLQKSLLRTYQPSPQESGNFYQESQEQVWAGGNFTASSSDSSIVKVEKDVENQLFVITGVAAGTATLTFDYRFEGDRGTYAGRQAVEFSVAPDDNPVVAIGCEPSTEIPLVTRCAITGVPHSNDSSVVVPVEVTAADSSRVPTGNLSLQVQSSDRSVVDAMFVEADASEGRYRIRLRPAKTGSADITVTGVMKSDSGEPHYTDPVTMRVEVADWTPKPTLRIAKSATKWYYPEQAGVATNPVIAPASAGIASYEDSKDLQAENAAHPSGSGLEWGNCEVERTSVPVFSATSDNTDVVAVQQDDQGHVGLQYKAVGTARVTVEDVWGSKGTCEVTVKDLATEVKKYRLSKNEITIKKGETLDLSDYIQAEQPVMRRARIASASAPKQELVGKPVFKSSNGNILPIKYNDDQAVSQVLGRNVGEVTVSANILKPGTEDAPLETIDQWEVYNFSTLTVRVIDPPADNPATGVEITGDANEVEIGSTLQLSAAITPGDATDADTLAWSTSNEAVAKVDATGKVTPVACGAAVITATVGSASDTYEITVVPQTVPATGVVLSRAQTAMKVGDVQQLSATLEPVGATDKLAWSSSDEKVLVVDPSGRVKAVGNGTASIRAAAGSAFATTDPIVVTTPVSGVALETSALELYAGAAPSTLRATVSPETASEKSVTWTSSNRAIAIVDAEGNVTPVSPGEANVVATTVDGGFTAACTVTVKQHAEGIALDKSSLTLTGASSAKLIATVAPGNATNREVRWSSSDEGVATVSADGTVAAVGKGAATVTASTIDGGFSASCSVAVSNPVTGIALAPAALSLVKGETATVSLTCTAALPGEMDEVGELVWTTSEQSVASVAPNGLDCVIEALSSGSAMVEASLNHGALSAACTVAVTNPLQSISLSEPARTVTVGDAPFVLEAIIDPLDADSAAVSWSTSDASVATVAPSGEVRIVGAGVANITAAAGGKTAACALTVKAKEIASAPSSSGLVVHVLIEDAETAKALQGEAGEDAKLVINGLTAPAAPVRDALAALQASGSTVAGTFDIHFARANGDEIVVDGKGKLSLTVKIEMTDAMKALDPATLQVSYLADDGTVEKMETWVEGDYLCFKTSHFSTYAVTGRAPAAQDGDAGSGEGAPILLAPTGDSFGGSASVLVLAAVAALAAMLTRRKTS